ncbi:MAG: hypothetical protein LBG73_04735 [Spirochaetaceae bacterium]|nr:hypothetical protein [Spirochaetaceae bacterium]
MAYHRNREYQRAIADYTEVLRFNPSDTAAAMLRQKAYAAMLE